MPNFLEMFCGTVILISGMGALPVREKAKPWKGVLKVLKSAYAELSRPASAQLRGSTTVSCPFPFLLQAEGLTCQSGSASPVSISSQGLAQSPSHPLPLLDS